MTDIYTGNEYSAELKTKKRMRNIWLICMSIVLAICIGMLIWYIFLPYKSPLQIYAKVLNPVLCSVFAVISFPLIAIKYNRQRNYVKMLSYLNSGLKEGYNGEFNRFSEVREIKEGVDFYSMIFLEWNENKQEYFERKVFVDMEKPHPEIAPGEMVHYITQGNILISYEIVERPENEPTTEEKLKSVDAKYRRDRFGY